MEDLLPLLKAVGKLGPNGLAFLNVLALFWLESRIAALERESDDRASRGGR